MKVVAVFVALIAVSTTQMSNVYNAASAGTAASVGMQAHLLATDSTLIPKCFPHCGTDGY